MKKPIITREAPEGVRVIDTEADILEALVEMEYPAERDPQKKLQMVQELSPDRRPEFVFVTYPWLGKTVRVPEAAAYRMVRSFRNRNLITPEEQQKLNGFTLAVAGMSIGSNVALANVISSISLNEVRLADADTLSLHNLNRIRSGLANVGRKKAHIIAEQLYELDPFMNITVLDEGLTRDNLEGFLYGAKVAVDAVDDLEIKIRIRLLSKRLGIPVVMVTDLEDRAMLDVERYDLDPNYPIFHGRAGEVTLETIQAGVTNELRVRLSTSIVGEENLTARMKQSLSEIGRSLPTWPQLGPAAFMAGSVAAYAVKRICLGELPSGRWMVALDALIGGKSDV